MAKFTRSGVFEASLAILSQYLEEEYKNYGDSTLATSYLRNASDLRSFGKLFKQKPQSSDEAPVFGKHEKLEYPFMGLTIGQIGLDQHRAGYKKNNYTGGRLLGKDKDSNTAYFESYRPVQCTIGASLETDNIEHIIEYATMLFEIGPRLTLLVMHDQTGFETEIGVQFDMDLTIPPADSSTPGDPYKFEHTIRIDTYMGIASEKSLIREVKVTAKVAGRTDETVFDIEDLPSVILNRLKFYELFDKASSNFKYDWNKEQDK